MKKSAWILSLFLLFSAASGFCAERETHIVERVTDGDTLVLDNGQKVRLIGVDTPEMHDKERNGYDAKRSGRDIKVVNAYAGKAKKYVAGLIEGGEVALEFDPGNAYLQNRDKYGRLLAYVYRTKDNLFVNSEIIKEGYGFSYGRFPYKYRSEFYALEKEAKRQKKGMWS